jgi:DNA-binding transcriptional ArsR family regulator
MDMSSAIEVLSALAQPSRLECFRLLVAHEPQGLAAGEIARRANVPQNTMSAHLAILARAGLVAPDRQGRSIIYRARPERVREISLFLLKDCCGGDVDLCRPLLEELSATRC